MPSPAPSTRNSPPPDITWEKGLRWSSPLSRVLSGGAGFGVEGVGQLGVQTYPAPSVGPGLAGLARKPVARYRNLHSDPSNPPDNISVEGFVGQHAEWFTASRVGRRQPLLRFLSLLPPACRAAAAGPLLRFAAAATAVWLLQLLPAFALAGAAAVESDHCCCKVATS